MEKAEIGRKILRGRAGGKAWNFEKRLEQDREGEITSRYLEEMME